MRNQKTQKLFSTDLKKKFLMKKMISELTEVFRIISDDETTRSVILTGSRRKFLFRFVSGLPAEDFGI